MTWLAYSTVLVSCVALSALFSGSEMGIYCTNRLKLKLRSEKGDVRAIRLRSLLKDEQNSLAVILVGTNVANYLATVAMAALLAIQLDLSAQPIEVYTTLLVTPLLFVFGEVVPKNVFQRGADRLLYLCSLPLVVAAKLFFPIVWIIRQGTTLVIRSMEPGDTRQAPLDHREHIAGLLSEALADSDAGGGHTEFVERVFRLSDTSIRSVMVPVESVIALDENAGRNQTYRAIRQSNHSRFPLYKGTARNVIGFVQVLDLLANRTWKRVGERIQPIEHVSHSSSVASTIIRARRKEFHVALVVDDHGQAIGIVTLKDLMEEIVGELPVW